MTPTRPSLLLIVGLLAGGGAWLVEVAIVAAGKAVMIAPLTLGAAAGIIGIVVALLAVPVYRVARKVPGAQVDPFYATRIVLLAKASSLAGALATGATGAILCFLLTRSVVPAASSVSASAIAVTGAVILLAGGLVAEKMCTLPPDDDSNKEPTP